MEVNALFSRDGDWFIPTSFTTGPWRPDAMNGGPPCSLISLAIHDALEPDEEVARIGVDLEKPVPLEPMQLHCTRRQVSRRVAHLSVELRTEKGVVASARALLLRGKGAVPLVERDQPVAPALPSSVLEPYEPDRWSSQPVVFHRDAIEVRFTTGNWGIPGPGTAWIRLGVPLIEGEPTPDLCQLMAIADLSSPLSQRVEPGSGVALINVDVNVTLAGNPKGPWFCIATSGTVSPAGIGLANTQLFDQSGPLGVITQSQIVNAAPTG
ncbi:MAG: thioesterase family protein [Actinomycetota bacterium]|nr:thioesterase family protein [Actinomycetota bacterium]MDP2287622.1 thioesterase family protein [Actinomycetota bacterium]